MIAGLISNVTPKWLSTVFNIKQSGRRNDIKFACFLNFKLLISENFTIFYDEEILRVDGDFSIRINCRTSFVVRIVETQFQN